MIPNRYAVDSHLAATLPAVIPVSASAIVDVNGTHIGDAEMMAHALANAVERPAPDFLVRRGGAFVNEYPRLDPTTGERSDGGPSDPAHLLGAFPCLFPYGRGGFELKRDVDISYEAHSKWALQYSDKRFRKDPYFPFQVFGVLQKRKICRAASLHVDRQAYRRWNRQIQSLTREDLLKASREETAGRPISNPVIRHLRKALVAVRSRVPATDEARTVIRADVWGTSLLGNLPSAWLTLNFSDTQNPIVQFLVGEEINLDDFNRCAGPDRAERRDNVAHDPYVGALFFHVMVEAALDALFGIKVDARGHIERRSGILGRVRYYVGAVESQNRGTLHLHILFWLEDSPSPTEMKAALQSEEFRTRVAHFISSVLRADVQHKTDTQVRAMRVDRDAGYARPLDPRKEPRWRALWERETPSLARSLQFHNCSRVTCLILRHGTWVCKRRAPWVCSQAAWVKATGEWGPERYCAFFNTWSPVLMHTLFCNHDLQLTLYGAHSQKVIWYISAYTGKKQTNYKNVSALLARTLMWHQADAQLHGTGDPLRRNKLLLERCANALSRNRELSAPEVINYLMGWGDTIVSNQYSILYWDSAEIALCQAFPELREGAR